MEKLVRVKAGDFEIKDSVKLDEITTQQDVSKYLIYPLQKLNYPTYELSDAEKEKVSHGMALDINMPEGIVILTSKNTLAAVAKSENRRLQCLKVFL